MFWFKKTPELTREEIDRRITEAKRNYEELSETALRNLAVETSRLPPWPTDNLPECPKCGSRAFTSRYVAANHGMSLEIRGGLNPESSIRMGSTFVCEHVVHACECGFTQYKTQPKDFTKGTI